MRTDKMDPASDPRNPEPEGAEVESARQLEMQAVGRPEAWAIDRDDLRRLADGYVALDLGEDFDDFLRWARERVARGETQGR